MFMQRSPRQQAKRPSVMKKLSALFSFFRVEAQSANGIELIRNFIAFLTAELYGLKFSSASCAANKASATRQDAVKIIFFAFMP